MNEILVKIADILGMTVDGVVAAAPGLLKEYVAYEAMGKIFFPLAIIFAGAALSVIISLMKEKWTVMKKGIIILIIATLSISAVSTIRVIVAPRYSLINNLHYKMTLE